MRALVRKTAQLGEVVEAAFDKAAHYSADPKEVSRLATQRCRPHTAPSAADFAAPRWPSLFRRGPFVNESSIRVSADKTPA